MDVSLEVGNFPGVKLQKVPIVRRLVGFILLYDV